MRDFALWSLLSAKIQTDENENFIPASFISVESLFKGLYAVASTSSSCFCQSRCCEVK